MTDSDSDIIFSAAVRDYTEEFFRRYERNLADMERHTNTAMNRMDAGSKQSSVVLGLVAGAVGGISSQLAGMAISAATAFPKLVKSATALTARVDTLGVALATVGHNAGYSDKELAQFEADVKSMGITTQAARQTLLQMAQANLDLSKASQLARVAQDAAVIANVNSSEATMRLIHGITTLNPIILRQLGIVVSAEKEYKKWAAANDTTTKSLDYATKQQIMLNAVLEAGAGIAGTYESAMGSVGKQVTSLPRHVEELQLALGRVFQPSYGQWVQWITSELKRMRKWFDENRDSLEDLSNVMGYFVEQALAGLSSIIDMASKVPSTIYDIGIAIADTIHKPEEEIDSVGTTFKKVTVIVLSSLAAWAKAATESISIIVEAFSIHAGAVKALFEGNFDYYDEMSDRSDALGSRIMNFQSTVSEAAYDAFKDMSMAFGLLEDVDMSDAEAAMDGTSNAADELAERLQEVVAKVDELNAKYAERAAEEAIKRTREEIEDAINTARMLEDIQRSYLERIDDIYKSAAKRRLEEQKRISEAERSYQENTAKRREDLAKSHNEKLLDIEISYRRTLEDIERNWTRDVQELARDNDAVAILRAARAKKQQLEDARIARQREIEDANIDYERDRANLEKSLAEKREQLRKDAQERMQQLEQYLQEQLASAEEARQKDLENLQRNLQRQQEDKERHRAWDAEDRARAHQKELEELGKHFASMEGLTEEGLRALLEEHASAIEDLEILWQAYYREQEHMAQQQQQLALTPPSKYGVEPTGQHGFIGGYQTGGAGLVHSPSTITVGESGPEAFAVMPLQSVVTHKFSDLNINLQGITPESEAQLLPVIYEAFVQLAHALAGA